MAVPDNGDVPLALAWFIEGAGESGELVRHLRSASIRRRKSTGIRRASRPAPTVGISWAASRRVKVRSDQPSQSAAQASDTGRDVSHSYAFVADNGGDVFLFASNSDGGQARNNRFSRFDLGFDGSSNSDLAITGNRYDNTGIFSQGITAGSKVEDNEDVAGVSVMTFGTTMPRRPSATPTQNGSGPTIRAQRPSPTSTMASTGSSSTYTSTTPTRRSSTTPDCCLRAA